MVHLRFVKQRQVDILTKSSLRLPTIHTVVYIHRDSGRSQVDIETGGTEKNGIEMK